MRICPLRIISFFCFLVSACASIHASEPYGLDLHGAPVQELAGPGIRLVVLVFAASDCPISNRYVPEIARLNREFIKQGVRCNAICPGTIESPSLGERITVVSNESGRSLEAVRQDFVARQPMGRLGTADEVAWLALFLGSDEASYITGQAHLVDGGMAL